MVANDLWERFGALQWSELPAPVQQVVRQCLLDWTGCTIAGASEPLAEILREELCEEAGDSGPCSLPGTDLRAGPMTAALINGATSHALDFDDTNTIMGGHPSAPVIPAALAYAEKYGCSGEDLLAAIVTGIEIECRLGLLIGNAHYRRGWHVTSTLGVFGAMSAVARLMQSDAETYGRAFGLAASQASGVKSNFGTMTKPFHAGHAAERGYLCARLAARGFTANPGSFEDSQGLVEAASAGELKTEALAVLDEAWLTTHTLFKYNAACYLTHATIEAIKSLGKVGSQDCEGMTLVVHPSLLNVCAIPEPVTGLEAKFSLAANAALTVLGHDTTDPATYVDQVVNEPAVQSLLRRVSVETDASLAGTQTRVHYQTAAGAVEEAFFDTGIPATDLNDQSAKLELKFSHLVTPTLQDRTATLKQLIEQVPYRASMTGWSDL
ncbi:MAG: MmgE/PrpD family protein [Pseudomonadales bacterium]|nr:MmgE/PrpD family protein [Pseudomonadales bacterium]